MGDRKQGPFVKKLAIRFMAMDAVPVGGGVRDALSFITDRDRLIRSARESVVKAFAAIDAVKSCADNPYGDDDEAIARAIVGKIESSTRTKGK